MTVIRTEYKTKVKTVIWMNITSEEEKQFVDIIRQKTWFEGEIVFKVTRLGYDMGYEVKFNEDHEPILLTVLCYSGTFPSSFWNWVDKTCDEIREKIKDMKRQKELGMLK